MDSAYVRKAPKSVPYSVKPIKDIKEYRHLVAIMEEQYQKEKEDKYQGIRAKAIKMVEEQMSVLKFTDSEREEVTVLAKRKAIRKMVNTLYSGTLKILEEPKPTKFQQIKQGLKRLWNLLTIK